MEKVSSVDKIPHELSWVINSDDIHSTASMVANIAVMSQILLFLTSLIIVVLVIVRSMF